MRDGRRDKRDLPIGGGCAIGVVNAVAVYFCAFGLGMSSRPPRGHEPGFFDIPVSMLWVVFVLCVPGPFAVWMVFHRRGLTAIGTAIALIGFLAFFGMVRSATMFVP